MWKLVFILVSITVFTIFFIQNMVKVPVQFLVTDPAEIRLTYLLLTAFSMGYLFNAVMTMIRKVRKNRMEKRMYVEDEEEEHNE